MEHFVIIVNGWKPLAIITKSSILDVAAVLDPPLNLSQGAVDTPALGGNENDIVFDMQHVTERGLLKNVIIKTMQESHSTLIRNILPHILLHSSYDYALYTIRSFINKHMKF